jgi:hypothetical protein
MVVLFGDFVKNRLCGKMALREGARYVDEMSDFERRNSAIIARWETDYERMFIALV